MLSMYKPTLAVGFLMVLCLKLTLCKSIDDGFEIEALDETIESKSARIRSSHQEQRHSKRFSDSSQVIRRKCFSGNLEETVKALGVLDLKGVRLVRVEGALYQTLLKNNVTLALKSALNASRDESFAKRSSTDICEEQIASTYILAHASGQIAYEVDTVVCQGEFCSSPLLNNLIGGEFGDCVLKKREMVVYLIDPYGNFVPKTIDIGCGCECLAYA